MKQNTAAEWITRAEAVARYGVSISTVDNLTRTGRIRRRKFPHRRPSVALSVADLEQLFSEEA